MRIFNDVTWVCYAALKIDYGCQHYIRVIRAILYGAETDTTSIVIRAISLRHDSYTSITGVRWLWAP